MEDCEILCLETGTTDDVIDVLKKFIDKHNQSFIFEDLNQNGRRQKLWSSLFHHLDNSAEVSCCKYCLSCIRLISRDKTGLNELICNKWLETLLHHAGLVPQKEASSSINESPVNYEVMLEALKCLCNIIFHSPYAKALSSKNNSLEGVLMLLRTYKDPELPYEIKFYNVKVLFLITAFHEKVAPDLNRELLVCLTDILDLILKEVEREEHDDKGEATSSVIKITLYDNQVELACGVLQTLFNLTMNSAKQHAFDDEMAEFLRLASILHDFLLCATQPCEKQYELHRNVVNLLMNLPENCYEKLMTPVQRSLHDTDKGPEYDGKNMKAVAVLLDFLSYKLDSAEQDVSSQYELVCPIMFVMVNCVNCHRSMRKFLRQRVLPPLTEVHSRPEEGTTLRNKLCRLLTSCVMQVRDLADQFLFILCKENVMRMVKYTGYGNAAGFLARSGAMLGESNNLSSTSGAQYSSDSEDSDTEEYKKFKSQINIMTGCCEKPHPDPMESMSEEQKEFEALELVKKLDKLTRDGIMQPCRIGEDGRPEPVGHVLELIENLSQLQIKPSEDD